MPAPREMNLKKAIIYCLDYVLPVSILLVVAYFLMRPVWSDYRYGVIISIFLAILCTNSHFRKIIFFETKSHFDNILYITTLSVVVNVITLSIQTKTGSGFSIVGMILIILSLIRIHHTKNNTTSSYQITLNDVIENNLDSRNNLLISDKITDKNQIYPSSFEESLSETIESSFKSDGISIGLIGKWGSGKTSMINIVSKRLKDTIYIHFRPWIYENNLPLLEALIDEISYNVGIPKLESASYRKKMIELLTDVKSVNLSSIALIPDYRRTKIINDYRNLVCNCLNARNKNLLIVIDDLDRCNDHVYNFLMSLITDVFNFDKMSCVFLYSTNFFKDEENLKEFIQKIITIEIQMPIIGNKEMHLLTFTCIRNILKSLKCETDENEIYNRTDKLSELIETPRDLINLLNSSIPPFLNNPNLDFIDLFCLNLISLKNNVLYQKIIEYRKYAQISNDQYALERLEKILPQIRKIMDLEAESIYKTILNDLMPGLFQDLKRTIYRTASYDWNNRFYKELCTEQYFSWAWDNRRFYEKCIEKLHKNLTFDEDVSTFEDALKINKEAQNLLFFKLKDEDFEEKTNMIIKSIFAVIDKINDKGEFLSPSPLSRAEFTISNQLLRYPDLIPELKQYTKCRKYWNSILSIINDTEKINNNLSKACQPNINDLKEDLKSEITDFVTKDGSIYSDEKYINQKSSWTIFNAIDQEYIDYILDDVMNGTKREKLRFCRDMISEGVSYSLTDSQYIYSYISELKIPDDYFKRLEKTLENEKLSENAKIILDICMNKTQEYGTNLQLNIDELDT